MAISQDGRVDDFESACARVIWSTLLPGAFVFILCVTSLPLPTWLFKFTRPATESLRTYLTLAEAEASPRISRRDSPLVSLWELSFCGGSFP
ncbi:hypothetical protein FA95DRAFT_1662774 [Auriscalpium vulgare]|uniref:Uncharacterized protein n=1 Tax=Auriscalpium vulgare TaxID=40419 RepID=A0ACB8R4D9_9AGAM|nr:hypothetical protein FA95DRAFT_1662774 [Auriscalpium vulgare]